MPLVVPRDRALSIGLVALFAFSFVVLPLALGNSQAFGAGGLHTYRISPLIIHTDLSAQATKALAHRVKAVLNDAAGYWKRPVRGPIECYVVDDPTQWEDYQLPHPLARLIIARVGGATTTQVVGHGIRARNVACVFASSKPGIVEHEIVHAYCGQSFHAAGPVWYQEGMAQLLAFGTDRQQGINCPADVLAQLKSKPSMTITQVRTGGRATQRLIRQFSDKTSRCAGLAGLIPVTDWDREDVRALREIKQFYCWNWFLCHFLYHNTNYRARFRKLGQVFLAQRQDGFAALFHPVWRQLQFEYDFTLAHLTNGYRVDLCSWDWDKPFHYLAGGRPAVVRIMAARGYQATGVRVEGGQRYEYRTEGTWSRGKPDAGGNAATVDAVAGECLEAVVLSDYRLSEPIVLDCRRSGCFCAPCSGCLYVRCRDRWDRLADNEGSVLLTLEQ